jgi:hypothetical protein
MKTNLGIEIKTISDANKFILDLFNNNELFHFDDIDEDYRFECNPTSEEIKQLNNLVNQLFEIENYDPFEFAMSLINKG